jgi:hypothetical protein
LAALSRPQGLGEYGGQSSTNERDSLLLTPYEDNPAFSDTETVPISQGFPGVNGREMIATYDPYDKVVARYTQPGHKAVPSWQEQAYPLDNRELIRWQSPQGGHTNTPASPTRSPVFQVDYTTETLTSDANLTGGSDMYGYSGPDYNAY